MSNIGYSRARAAQKASSSGGSVFSQVSDWFGGIIGGGLETFQKYNQIKYQNEHLKLETAKKKTERARLEQQARPPVSVNKTVSEKGFFSGAKMPTWLIILLASFAALILLKSGK